MKTECAETVPITDPKTGANQVLTRLTLPSFLTNNQCAWKCFKMSARIGPRQKWHAWQTMNVSIPELLQGASWLATWGGRWSQNRHVSQTPQQSPQDQTAQGQLWLSDRVSCKPTNTYVHAYAHTCIHTNMRNWSYSNGSQKPKQ